MARYDLDKTAAASPLPADAPPVKDYLERRKHAAPLAHLKALAEGLVPAGTAFAPKELGWEVPGARRVKLEKARGAGWTFSVEASTRAKAPAATVLLDWVRDGKLRRPLLRMLDAEGRLLRWELSGKEGAEGEFDDRGALAVGRQWSGDEQTVIFRAEDGPRRPQLRFHRYRKGVKVGVRVITLNPDTQRAAEIREYDGSGELVRLARIGKEGKAEVSEPERRLASPVAKLPAPVAKPPAPKPAPKPAPPTKPAPKPKPAPQAPKPVPPPPQPARPPDPRPLSAPPGALLGAANDGSLAGTIEVIRRFGPAVGQSRKLVVQGAAGPETWLVRREAHGRSLKRPQVENELLMREVVRSFYGELFETAPAVGLEAGERAALIERLTDGTTVQQGFRPFSPRERAALATLCLVFGLSDLGPEHFVWREGRKPVLTELSAVRRQVYKLADVEKPVIAVELRLGRLPFIRQSPPLEREEYLQEAARIAAALNAPGFALRLRSRLQRAGLSEADAKSYVDAAAANLTRFEANLEPYLDAASGLEDLTDSGG